MFSPLSAPGVAIAAVVVITAASLAQGQSAAPVDAVVPAGGFPPQLMPPDVAFVDVVLVDVTGEIA